MKRFKFDVDFFFDMSFDLDKKNALSKLDKSKKGSVDEKILPLVELLNSKSGYYTTSTCSGRILLISFPEENRKYNVKWEYLSHVEVDFDVVKDNLNKIIDKFKEESIESGVWFKQESAIIHVCCRTLEDASKLLEASKHIGFKRSGISTMSNRIMLELVSTENMGVPVIKDGKKLVYDEYLKVLVDEANKKLKKTHEKIDRLIDNIKEI